LFRYRNPGHISIVGGDLTRERLVAKKPKKLEDLFHETLKDIYFAENKILKTLPKMAKAAQSKELRAAFVKHERETKGQVKRLDRVFKIIGKPARGKTCAAINGITEEGSEIMKDFKGMPALDAGLLAAAQAVEHYEISRYGTLSTWAEELGYAEAVDLLEATLRKKRTPTKPLPELPSRLSMWRPSRTRPKTGKLMGQRAGHGRVSVRAIVLRE